MLERADLEHIGVVPALAQGGVAKDEARGLVERQQALLVLEDEIVGALIIGLIAVALELGVNRMPFLVDGEVSLVRCMDVDAAQPFQVAAAHLPETRIERGVEILLPATVLINGAYVLLLKDSAVLAQVFLAVVIIDAVLGDLIDKEERQALDAARKQCLFLFQMALDSLADLNAAHIAIGGVAVDVAAAKLDTVEKLDVAQLGIAVRDDLGHGEPVAVRLELAGRGIDVVLLVETLCTLGDRARGVESLELDNRLRRLVLGDLDVLKV